MTVKQINTQLKKRLIALGTERDKLRDLVNETKGLRDACEQSYYALESAIDYLSELV